MSLELQNLIVALVCFASLAYVVRTLWKLFSPVGSGCGGSCSGCSQKSSAPLGESKPFVSLEDFEKTIRG